MMMARKKLRNWAGKSEWMLEILVATIHQYSNTNPLMARGGNTATCSGRHLLCADSAYAFRMLAAWNQKSSQMDCFKMLSWRKVYQRTKPLKWQHIGCQPWPKENLSSLNSCNGRNLREEPNWMFLLHQMWFTVFSCCLVRLITNILMRTPS